MGRSVLSKDVLPEGTYYHRISNRHYAIANGVVRRHQKGANGAELNVLEKPVNLAIGSGNHAYTPIHRTPLGKLIELPVTWYTGEKAWAMSPGYDRPDHLGFRRPITPECLFCHAAYPDTPAATPRAIDCVRCHGDTGAHLRRPQRGSILNPARLPPDRQLDICLQCHLETASSGFPDSLRLSGRDVFSYRPGEPLAAYKAYFDRADHAPRFEINHAGYRMLESRCFAESKGALTCTTCHDPHTARARNACAGCHKTVERTHGGGNPDCASCHMPKRPAGDAPHVEMTDHRIAKPGPAERHDPAPYSGPLVAFANRANAAMLRQAQALHFARTNGSAAAWKRTEATTANLAALADALMREGRHEEALPVIDKVLKADPDHVTALNGLAVYHGMRGRTEQALAILERARAADPDHPLTWINLGVAHEALGDRALALDRYNEAVRLQPDSQEARRRRAAVSQ
ncbi:MAG: tetratricopeptide repeat protein [Bryobacteraceae bacterium]